MTTAILAAEQSGDQLGAGLLKALKQPAFGMGGALLQAAGLEPISQPIDAMGVSDVITHLPQLLLQLRHLKKTLCQRAPQRIITIDAPDLFLPLHRALRKGGYRGPIIHLVSPSVWAWRHRRVHQMAKHLNLLISLFPFEAEYYAQTKLPVKTITHPLAFDILTQSYQPLKLSNPRPLLALFPGSRRGEIERNLPAQLEAAQAFPTHQLVVCLARESLRPLIPNHLATVGAEERHALMKRADCAIATSGTICLELALHGVPTVATYALSRLNYVLAHRVFKIHLPHYTLPNLISRQELLPEHIDLKIESEEIAFSLKQLLTKRPLFDKLCRTFHSQFDLESNPYEQAAALSLSLG